MSSSTPSSSLSSSPSSLFSSLSSTPTQPSPTQPPSEGPSNGGPPTQTGDASLGGSASLYLYTFLATLVLLLVVSAAIVVRSLMLRRRHRIMIEEAIRSGTLPPPFAYQRPRVDLSKKPKMWNAWIETAPEPHKTSGQSREKEWYWDMMKPFSAISTASLPNGSGDDHQLQNRRPSTSSFIDRLRNFGHIVSSPINSTNDSMSPSSTQLASAAAALANLDSGNVALKVAVLIAMPRKPPSSSLSSSPSNKTSHQPSSSILSTSRSPQPSLSRPVSASPSSRPLSAATITEQWPNEDDEEPLPHLEVGVTEVRVVPHIDDPDADSQEKRSTSD